MATPSTPPPSGQDVAGSAFFKKFLGAAEGYLSQPTRLKTLLTDAYQKAAAKNEVGHLAHEAWDTLQSLFRLIRTSVSGEYTGVPTTTVIAAVAVLIYFLSPIDLIPDFVPVLGLLDDVALVAWFSSSVKTELDKFHAWEEAKAAAPRRHNSYDELKPADTSAKNAGTYNLPEAPPATGQSATDAGLGSPSSTVEAPIHTQGADVTPSDFGSTDDVANVGDGSRDGDKGQWNGSGGNSR